MPRRLPNLLFCEMGYALKWIMVQHFGYEHFLTFVLNQFIHKFEFLEIDQLYLK